MAGRIQAAYMLAPLVMDLADKKIPVKIVSLGHRSGAVIMVRTDSPYQQFQDLAGKRIAIPSRFAVDFLFLRKMLAQEGMTPKDIEIVEMAPPDMPAALYAKAVDAYCTGEPFGAAAQRAGYARALRMTRDEWRNYICCVLTVREELIRRNRPLVQDTSSTTCSAPASGSTSSRRTANKAVAIAAGRKYFNQDPNIIRFVMENPTDRVTYGDLRMIRARVRRADAAVGRGRHAEAARSPTRSTWTRASPGRRGPRRSALTVRSNLTLLNRAAALLLSLLLASVGRDDRPRAPRAAPALKAGVFEPPRAAPEFALRGSDGTELTLARYRGKVVLLSFGFTHCAAVCPITLATLAAGAQEPRRRGGCGAGDLRDRRSRARRRRPDEGLPGGVRSRASSAPPATPDALAAVRRSYGVTARKQGTGDDYAMDHSSSIFLIDRAGKLRAHDALRARRRRLRARHQAAAGAVTQPLHATPPTASLRHARPAALAARLVAAVALCCSCSARLAWAALAPIERGFARRAVRDSARHLGAPHGRRQGRDPAGARSG